MSTEIGVFGRAFHPAVSVGAAVEQARGRGEVVWVGVQGAADGRAAGPDGDELAALGLDGGLAHLVERRSGHAGFARREDRTVVTLLEPGAREGDDDQVAPIALQAVVAADRVVVILRRGGPDGLTALRQEVEARLRELPGGAPVTGWALLAALLLAFVDRYEDAVDELEDGVRTLADRLFTALDEHLVEEVHRAGQRALRLARAVRPVAQGLHEALDDEDLATGGDARRVLLRLRTAADDLTERIGWVERTLDSLVESAFGLSWQRGNRLAARQNAVTQRISAFALLFAIPSVVFSLYGVNVTSLPRVLTESYGYPVLVLLTAALVGAVAWRLRRDGWL